MATSHRGGKTDPKGVRLVNWIDISDVPFESLEPPTWTKSEEYGRSLGFCSTLRETLTARYESNAAAYGLDLDARQVICTAPVRCGRWRCVLRIGGSPRQGWHPADHILIDIADGALLLFKYEAQARAAAAMCAYSTEDAVMDIGGGIRACWHEPIAGWSPTDHAAAYRNWQREQAAQAA